MSELLVENLSFAYNSDEAKVLAGISLALNPGSFNLLIGASGSGKSTLLKIMAGLYPHFGGTILDGQATLEGQTVGEIVAFERARHVAMLFQNPTRQFAMTTPTQEIQFALENLQVPVDEINHRIQQALQEIQIQDLAERQLRTLSGGEQQKVALAIVLAMDSQIILLDEPFANVDPAARIELLALLKHLQTEYHKTILLSDHDLSGYQDLVEHLYQISNHGQLDEINLEVLNQTDVQVHFPNRWQPQAGPLNWQNLTVSVNDWELFSKHDFQVPTGMIGLISGANGAGKSTFFKTLAHQLPYTGTIRWDEQDSAKQKLKEWVKLVGYGFQSAPDQYVTMTVADEISISLKHSQLPNYWNQARIDEALNALSISGMDEHVVYQLSGGQQKKLQILSLLIIGFPVLLLDEPLAGLDADSLQSIMLLIRNYVDATKHSVLMISHQRHGLEPFIDFELALANHRLTLVGGADHA